MLKHAIDRCKKSDIIVDGQIVLCTGRTGFTSDRLVRQKRGLGFCVFKPASRKVWQKGVIPNSDVSVGHSPVTGRKSTDAGCRRRRSARGTSELAYERNSTANLVLRLARGLVRTSAVGVTCGIVIILATKKSALERGEKNKNRLTASHQSQKNGGLGDGLPRLRRASRAEKVVSRPREAARKATTTNHTNRHE